MKRRLSTTTTGILFFIMIALANHEVSTKGTITGLTLLPLVIVLVYKLLTMIANDAKEIFGYDDVEGED